MSIYYKVLDMLPQAFLKASVVILIAVICFISIKISLALHAPHIVDGSTVVYVHEGGILFEEQDSSRVFLKVTPFDDYYYSAGKKEHVGDRKTTKRIDSLEEYGAFLQSIFTKPKHLFLSFTQRIARKPAIRYEVISKGKGFFTVIRQLNPSNKKIDTLGQSIVLCYDCLVTDGANYLYFNYELLASNREEFAKKLGFTLFSIHHSQPLPLYRNAFFIRNSEGKLLYSVSVREGDRVYYDEKFRLIEIKRTVEPGKQIDMSIRI